MRYKVGDKIIIKLWHDMASEFGIDGFGDIMCDCVFLKKMNSLCGNVLEIVTVNENYYEVIESKFSISDDMVYGKGK